MLKVLCLLLISVNMTVGDDSDEYIDPVIDMLLNGVNSKTPPSDVSEEEEPVLISGIWKCGNCTDIDNSKLVYSEDNYADDDSADNDSDVQCMTNKSTGLGIWHTDYQNRQRILLSRKMLSLKAKEKESRKKKELHRIELKLEGMRCVTVAADKPGVVRIQAGACEGGAVSLHVAPTRHFVVKAYD